MKIIYQKRISRDDLRANPEFGYVFGDNLELIGRGGQAYEMRGEPNSIGIPTKKSPIAYMTDDEYKVNTFFIANAFKLLDRFETIVWPLDGIGTGLANLEKMAPKTWAYLIDLCDRFGIKNPYVFS